MRLGLIGFGNIATALLDLLARGGPLDHLAVLVLPGMEADARRRLEGDLAGAARSHAVVTDAAALLAERPGLVVECAGHAAAQAHVPAVLRAGVDVILVSIGALADPALEAALRAAAAEGGARLVLPAGAVGAIDLLSALGAGGGVKVRYRGAKPPAAWAGTPAAGMLDLGALTEARVFFTGTAREAATAYPRNANVAATLALAGAGFEETQVELVADPAAPGNVHEYTVASPLANYTIRIENRPSEGNAKTSATTIYSVLREIRNRLGPVAI
ncbi:aspartate dehydrogenase [Ruixingdingia sedimenti]|uniref:L-aspartate dehydrogenase n=1 Tax=Ruixingdingia sedimenti TaxID=3073604 RepID=A0ABU1FBF2_9RHOB|nr:aspartate dehydrogenase [Xinfangfangia sp. LG-4]MDR5654201.1 aspartate dehydrogenase [Xinfangfangia sp. LG-4]